MLSFLIALVKKSFDTQMKSEVQNTYQMRTEMNNESSMVLRLLGLLHETDLFILSAQFDRATNAPDKI